MKSVSLANILALAAAVFILAATPGPGIFATLSRALASGFKPACLLAAGIVIGDLIFLLFSIYGLAAAAKLLGGFFLFVKYAGGLYLVWLGFNIMTTGPGASRLKNASPLSNRANFLSGLMITLGNPKVILFYLGFLPTFLDLDRLTYMDVLIAVVVVSGVLGSVLLGYAFTASRARRMLTNPRARRWMNLTSGSVMMTTGAVLISRN